VHPESGLDGQGVFALFRKLGDVIGVGGQRDAPAEIIDIPDAGAVENLLANLRMPQKLDLLQKQPVLDGHKLLRGKAEPATAHLPELFSPILAN
jgi:hypothetical protein